MGSTPWRSSETKELVESPAGAAGLAQPDDGQRRPTRSHGVRSWPGVLVEPWPTRASGPPGASFQAFSGGGQRVPVQRGVRRGGRGLGA